MDCFTSHYFIIVTITIFTIKVNPLFSACFLIIQNVKLTFGRCQTIFTQLHSTLTLVSSLLCWKLTPLVSSPLFPCLPLINMCKGRVNDVTHCFILEKKVPSCILIKCLPPYIMKWIGLLMSVTLLHIGTIGLPRLARDLLTLIG